MDEPTWQAINGGRLTEIPKQVLDQLIEIELLVPAEENEREVVLTRNSAAALDNDDLYVVVQPTAWCQLGCDYCGQSHSSTRLSSDRERLLVESVRTRLASGAYKTVTIGWFGAEPLSGLAEIRTLSASLIAIAEDYGCDYRAKLVTNGLALTPEVATELIDVCRVRFIEVTLDGGPESHNARRHTKRGGATFDRIFENVVRLARRPARGARLRVRCNVDSRNYDGVVALLDLLQAAGIQKDIDFYIAPIHSWGNDAHLLSLEKDEFARREIDWYREMISRGFEPSLLPGRREITCLAMHQEGFLVDATGSLFNCTEVSYVPTYGDPNVYSIGTLEQGEIAGRRRLIGDFNDEVAEGKYGCATCQLLPVCGGSCPKQWKEGISPCPPYKRNMPDRLALSYATTR